MRRREFVLGALGTGTVSSILPRRAFAANAASRPIPYGTCIRTDVLANDPAYRQAVIDYCQVIVGEGATKWSELHPERGTFYFDEADGLLDFAEEHGMELRGHTLAWYGAMPEWTEAIASREEAEAELVRHIETVVGRYKGRIKSWDVINEPLADYPTPDNMIRESIWQKFLGRDYIELALRTAARVDPDAQLVINDYDLEQSDDRNRARRKAFLDIVRDLKARDVPLHAIGLQGHIKGEVPIDRPGLTSFVAELTAMGLGILVTELDIIDNWLPAPEAERDAKVAAVAKEFLDAIGAVTRPEAVVTWGISDRHTWVPIWFSRNDGLPNRPLPLDADYQPKPFMQVIQDFVRSPS